ncbi:MAG: two-component system response regulator [Bacillales bacterium]|jgi:two-component system chemotaxis response regulator CheY|nr:two-component system response regulator [Bacillales bacterium]
MGTVLITDDSLVMRMQLKNMVTKLGHEVVGEAENGLVAIKKYKELKPDLVTMDITMPEMSGIEAVKEIININPNAKIVMCSAMGQQSMILDAIQAGAKDFIVKPFDPPRVQQSLLKIFDSK